MRPSSKDAFRRLLVLESVVMYGMVHPSKEDFAKKFQTMTRPEQAEYEAQCKALAGAQIKVLKECSLWDYASPEEKAFLATYGLNLDEIGYVQSIWRREALWMLGWAFGLCDWPAIDKAWSPEAFKMVSLQKVGFFTKHPDLRPTKEIDAKRDIMEAWHWRVRTRQLIEEGHPFPKEQMAQTPFNSFDDIVRMSAKEHYKDGDLPEIIDEDYVFLGKPFRDLSSSEYDTAMGMICERHFALNWLCGYAPGNRWDETPTET